MEKLGIAKQDLLKELKQMYLETKEQAVSLTKEGSENPVKRQLLEKRLTAIQAKIDEVESQGG